MKHDLFITLPYKVERAAPPFEDNDISYPESYVRHFIGKYSKRGDSVFDPFTGLGTTMFICEEMKRVPYGIEWDRRRFEWVAGQMRDWTHLVNGDAAKCLRYGFPKMDFSISSPPYMPNYYKVNALGGGAPSKNAYADYIKRMGYIYAQAAQLLKRNAHLVIHLDNIPGRSFTPLVRDVGASVAAACAKTLRQEAETIVAWKNPNPDWLSTHALVFRKR
jgi:hypothetical protein